MSNKGFTLIELMITLVIAAILLTTAVPSFEALITNNRLSTQANAFIGALYLARAEAIKRNLDVTVCKSGDGQNCSNNASGFEQGWIVFVDKQNFGIHDVLQASDPDFEAIINTNQGMPQGMSLDDQTVSYRSDGTPASFNNTTLRLCQQGNNNGRHIVISVTGRVRVEESNDCPIN